jgi:PAS domain S-box-containing protein
VQKNVCRILLVILLLIIPTLSNANFKLRVGVYENYPVIFMDGDTPKGLFIDILEHVAKGEGWTLEYVKCDSWIECFQKVRFGGIDIHVGVAYSIERDDYLDYNKESILTYWTTIYQRPLGGINNILDLDGKTVAVMEGDYNAEEFINLTEEFNINCEYVWVKQPIEVFDKLVNNEVSAAIINSISGMVNSVDYDVRQTSIVFNPFGSFFVTREGKFPLVLQAIDDHIKIEKKDKLSYYHSRLNYWISKINPSYKIDLIFIYLFCGALGLVFIFLYFKEKETKAPIRISLVYLIIGTIWIVVSDNLMFGITDPENYRQFQTLKGILYVILTTCLIFVLIRHSIQRIRDNETRYSKVIQTVPHGMLELDKYGVIKLANTTFFEMIGYKNGELIGQKVQSFVDSKSIKDINEMLGSIRQGYPNKNTNWFGKAVTKRGRTIDIEVNWSYLYGDDHISGIVAVVTDNTEKNKIQIRSQVANEILNLLNRTIEIDETIQQCLDLLKDKLFISAVAVRLTKDGDYPYFKSQGFDEVFTEKEKCLLAVKEVICVDPHDEDCEHVLDCLCGCVIEYDEEISPTHFTEKGSFWSNNLCQFFQNLSIEDKERYHIRGSCEVAGFKSICLIPLRFGNRTIGLLQLNDRRVGVFTKDVINFFEGIADSLGIALYRKVTELELTKSERTLNAIFNAAPIGMGIINNRIFGVTNKHLHKMIGRGPEELFGKSARILYPTQEEYERVGREKHPQVEKYGIGWVETKFKHKDGTIKDIILSSSSIGEDGEMVFTSVDITERKNAEEKIIRSEVKYRGLFENMLDGFALHEIIVNGHGVPIDYRYLTVNPAFERITGFKKDYVEGKTVKTVLPKIEDHWIQRFGNVALTGESDNFEEEVMSMDNRVFEVTAYSPKTNQFAVLFQDITDRKRAENDLKEKNDQFDKLISGLFDGFVRVSLDRIVISANRAFCEMIGYTEDELKAITFENFTHPDDWVWEKPIVEKLVNGEQMPPYEKRYIHKDGSVIDIELAPYPISDDSGNVVELWGIAKNLTPVRNVQLEIIEKEKQLRRASKMEAVGTLAGGLAHDFNNIIQIVSGNVQLMRMDLDSDGKTSDWSKMLNDMLEASERGAAIAKRLLTFSRQVESHLVPIDINDEIIIAHKLLDRTATWPVLVNIKLDLDEDICLILADSTQINQIVTNLCINAKDAMPSGGSITIKTRVAELDELYCRSQPEAVPGRYVCMVVADDGIGMKASILERIFEPFFTTKSTGKGTGLGLAVVYGIVKNHNGFITVYSEENIGTEFKVYVPCTDQTLRENNSSSVCDLSQGNKELILIVDDESSIRFILKDILRRYNFKVLEANNGTTCLDLYSKYMDKIELVILDLVMPGISGTETLKEILKINPDAKVIISSGYSSNGPVKDSIENGAYSFINKPYTLNNLISVIKRVLSGKRDGVDEIC